MVKSSVLLLLTQNSCLTELSCIHNNTNHEFDPGTYLVKRNVDPTVCTGSNWGSTASLYFQKTDGREFFAASFCKNSLMQPWQHRRKEQTIWIENTREQSLPSPQHTSFQLPSEPLKQKAGLGCSPAQLTNRPAHDLLIILSIFISLFFSPQLSLALFPPPVGLPARKSPPPRWLRRRWPTKPAAPPLPASLSPLSFSLLSNEPKPKTQQTRPVNPLPNNSYSFQSIGSGHRI